MCVSEATIFRKRRYWGKGQRDFPRVCKIMGAFTMFGLLLSHGLDINSSSDYEEKDAGFKIGESSKLLYKK